MNRVRSGIAEMPVRLTGDADGAEAFCQAILTTDLVKKTVCVKLDVGGRTVHVAGAAKGSGMIHPNMATMLGFHHDRREHRRRGAAGAARQATGRTFNRITVDGDTSTNDMVVAHGQRAGRQTAAAPDHPDWSGSPQAFSIMSNVLAKAIARDGEGATKLIEVRSQARRATTTPAASREDDHRIRLVKSAVYGTDANWGRISAAAGRAGRADRSGDGRHFARRRQGDRSSPGAVPSTRTRRSLVLSRRTPSGRCQL